jgi:membrane protease YdiL (CAAX protease family)
VATLFEYIALRFVLGMILSFVSYHLTQQASVWVVLYNASVIVAYLLYVGVGLSHARNPWIWGNVSTKHVLWAAMVVAVVLLARLEQLHLLPERLSLLTNAESLPHSLAVFVLIPIKEELLYRGILLRRAADGLGFWPGLLLSSTLFGLGHPSLGVTLVMGMLFGYLYSPRSTATLLTPIVVHVLANLTGLLPLLPEGIHF